MLIPLPLTFPQMHDLYWDQWTLTFLRQGASMPMTVYHFSYFDLWYCLWPAACTQTIDLTFSHTCDIWPYLILMANTPWPCQRLVVFMLTPVTFDLLSGLWPIFIDQISELCLYFTNINSCWPFSDLWHLTMPHTCGPCIDNDLYTQNNAPWPFLRFVTTDLDSGVWPII